MLELLTVGTIAGWLALLVSFLLAYAPERSLTEIIRDADTSR
jgi:hypothetical protein